MASPNATSERTPKWFVSVQKFADDLELETLYTPNEELCFVSTGTNRPGLLFAGYEEHFPAHRANILGNAEMSYLASIGDKESAIRLEKLFGYRPPCVIISRGRKPSEPMLEIAGKYEVALYSSTLSTTQIESDLTNYLATALAEEDMIHGELLDISGIGVLLIGDSGIGKSETALELVHRGHMLVADDLVEVKRIKNKIYGYPNKRTANLLEVRGVGLIDVEAMYGVGGVLAQKRIHLVIEMEQWDDQKSYDRLGDDKLTYNILGVEFDRIVIPVSAGRNLAVVIEAASRNFRLKSMGKDALDELSARIREKNRPRTDLK